MHLADRQRWHQKPRIRFCARIDVSLQEPFERHSDGFLSTAGGDTTGRLKRSVSKRVSRSWIQKPGFPASPRADGARRVQADRCAIVTAIAHRLRILATMDAMLVRVERSVTSVGHLHDEPDERRWWWRAIAAGTPGCHRSHAPGRIWTRRYSRRTAKSFEITQREPR